MAQAVMYFPSDFLWGTATAAFQVEGHNTNSDWWHWEQQPGAILHGHKSGMACNWWANAEADLDIAAEMGTNAHRLSLEWSRIEPEPSYFDTAVLDRYRQILQAMHNRGIEPMVTLHHFSNPLWLVEKGDFNQPLVVDYFRRYVRKVAETLGDLIPKWVTINEPLVYVFMRYLDGKFPPPKHTGWAAAGEAIKHLLHCHAAAYHTIKEVQPQAQVGIAKNMAVFAARPSQGRMANWWAGRLDWLFNEAWMEAMVHGRSRFPFGKGTIPHLANTFDFVGINYYTRFYAKFPPIGGLLHQTWGPDAIVTDGNYGEIYPQGLYQMIRRATRYGKPIYITENGLPDKADQHRAMFLISHLREIWRAVSFCFPVMGYYHWTLVDNFEWDRGWTQRFGLIELDPESQERRWRKSGRLYAEICQLGGISSTLAEKYAPQLLPVYFPGEAPEQNQPQRFAA